MTKVTAQKIDKMKWTAFRALELDDADTAIYELFDGIVMKRSAPSLVHQRISRKLLLQLDAFIEANQLGEVFSAPVDLYLDDYNAFQPDLAFVSKDRSFLIEAGDYIRGAPDLVVEIISAGSFKRDKVTKKELCERFAVREYWLVDPLNQGIEIYVMQDDAYVLHDIQEGWSKIVSTVLTGFELDLGALFGLEKKEEEAPTEPEENPESPANPVA